MQEIATQPALLSFQPDADAIEVDLDVLITSKMLIQANSGGGKSYTLRYLLEQTYGRVPQIVFDPEGEFASLREQFAYVLAGVDGDVPARPELAAPLCRRLVELGASVVLDLYELESEERELFVRNFLVELLRLPRALWRPLLVIIDEAHLFCPEKGAGTALSKKAVSGLCTRGRKRGFCAVLATQRLAALDKAVAAELNNVLIGRTGLDVDVERAGKTLGFGNERRATLPHLDPGVFYAFGPAISRQVVHVRTGQVRTSHPSPGQIVPPAPPPPDQLRNLIAQLADLSTHVECDSDPGVMQRRIVELERELHKRPVVPQFERIEVPVFQNGQLAQLEQLVKELAGAASQLVNVAQGLETALERVGSGATPVPPPGSMPASPREPSAQQGEHSNLAAMGSAQLVEAQQRILDALLGFEALGIQEVARQHLAIWSRQSPRSSAFGNHLGLLRSLSLIDYPQGGYVALTEQGRHLALPSLPIHSLTELHAAWETWLPGAQARILRVLIAHYPDALERARLTELSEQSARSSAYGNHLGTLRSLELIAYPQPGQVRASVLLFPTLKRRS